MYRLRRAPLEAARRGHGPLRFYGAGNGIARCPAERCRLALFGAKRYAFLMGGNCEELTRGTHFRVAPNNRHGVAERNAFVAQLPAGPNRIDSSTSSAKGTDK